MSDTVYEVFALKYAHHDRRSDENFLFGDPHDILQPLAYFVWLVVGPSRTFLVDTGFDAAMAQKRGRTITTPVVQAIERLGVEPASIEDVILTHLHYDHCGNYDAFPRARYHLQDSEIAYATGRLMTHPVMRIPFEVDDIVAMVRRVFAGRVQFHDGDEELAPGVSVHRIGGHSKGLQCVRVMTRRGPVVLASDATHLYAHVNEGRVYPVTYNVGEVLEGYATIRRLAASAEHIIPGHDPAVLDLYPPASSSLEGIAARLDVAPRQVAVVASTSFLT
jgi:glyoxylase-like metal-dependent hydrolase (beta-lactamase superfamily II)